ncbi:MAG TPA: substrate-binding domain-containing protein [Burkholderiaceae bacterium]|nr:substrate-binding domain-containing protein [Burkholderiaceae bacterium]
MKEPDDKAPRQRDGRVTIRLQYAFADAEQRGAELDNSVFLLLAAVRDAGSIAHAAAQLGLSYRHVWGQLRDWDAKFGTPLVDRLQGHRARLTDFGERLLWAERRARTRMQPHIDALRASLACIVAEASDTRTRLLSLHASHDLALPRLREHAAQQAALHMDIRFMGSIDSLDSLNAERCLVAGFHVPALRGSAPVFAKAIKPLLKPGRHKLIGCSRRTQGLMLRKEHAPRIRALTDLAGSPLRFVNRQPGSGTRLLMDHLMQAYGLRAKDIAGYDRVEETHVAVAACIASGAADVGLGVEAAALEFGLHFVPIVTEDYFLACLQQNLEHPAIVRLREVLASPEWSALLHELPGYAPAAAPGAVLMMTAVLPWWRFSGPKRRRRQSAVTRVASDRATRKSTTSSNI